MVRLVHFFRYKEIGIVKLTNASDDDNNILLFTVLPLLTLSQVPDARSMTSSLCESCA